jgi:hypothetical protein
MAKESLMRDLGPSVLIEVHAPDTVWKTVQPPVPIRLPMTFASRKLSLRAMQALGIMSLALFIGAEAFVFWELVIAGGLSVNQKLRGMSALTLGAGMMPFLRVMYYNGAVNSLAAGDCLFVGIDGFLDARLLAEPILWANVTAVEPVATKGGLLGAKLKLKEPCFFSGEFKATFPRWLFKKYRDDRNVFISMTLKHEGKKYDPKLLFEIFKNRIDAANGGSLDRRQV